MSQPFSRPPPRAHACRGRRALCLCATAALVLGACSTRDPIEVDTTADGPDAVPGDDVCGDGTSGTCSVRAAFEELAGGAHAFVTVRLPAGTYPLELGELEPPPAVSRIEGAGPDATVIDARGDSRVVRVERDGGVLELTGLTIAGGRAYVGAGLHIEGGSGAVSLTDVVVEDNRSEFRAGGLYVGKGNTVTLDRVAVRNNRGGLGGAGGGGGMVVNARTRIVDSEFTGNVGTQAGAIWHGFATLTVERSTFAGNRSFRGAITVSGGAATLRNVTVSGNDQLTEGTYAYDGGGAGIRVSGTARASLVNATVTENGRPGSGNGQGLSVAGTAEATLANTLLAGNRYGDCASAAGTTVSSFGYNLVGILDPAECRGNFNSLDLLGAPGASIDPGLAALANNGGGTRTHALRPGSPARDAGAPAGAYAAQACEAVDQRGTGRPRDGDGDGGARCDIGAFEAGL